MNFIVNHTIRSAKKNWIQILVIVIAVAVSTMMLFASFSLSDVFYNINALEYSRASQGADILIGNSSADSGVQFSRARIERILSDYQSDIEYAEYFLRLGTVMRTESDSKYVVVEATDLEEYCERHQISYVERDESTTYELMPAIISASFAEDMGLHAGDDVEVYLQSYGIYAKLNVAFIAENKGIFSSETTANILVDLSAVGSKGQVSAVYIKLINPIDLEETVQSELPNVSVGEGDSHSYVMEIVKQNTMLLTVGIIFIVAIMMLILLTSYQIIARHRMSEMVTFKAVGATPLQVALIMLIEVALYAIAGSVLGVLIGRLAMQIAVNMLLPMARGAITFDAWKYIVSIILGVLVAIVAALVPVISTSKKTIRQLTSNGAKAVFKKENPILAIASLVLVVGAVIAMSFLKGIALIILSAVSLVLIVLMVKFNIGYIIKGVAFIGGKIRSTGPPKLAAVSIGRSKSMRTITLLISVLVAFSFVVVEVVGLVKTAVEPFRGRYDADIVAYTDEKSSVLSFGQVARDISLMAGVEECGYFNNTTFITSCDKDSDSTITLYGVSDFETLKRCSSGGLSDVTKDVWLKEQNPLVISKEMSLRCGWKRGDKIRIITASEDFQDRPIEFTIVGIDNTYSEWDEVGYCRFELLESEFGVTSTTFLINTDGTNSNAFISVRSYFDSSVFDKCYVLPFEEWAFAGKSEISSGVSVLLTILQVSIYVVSILGVFNISVVTVFDRRKEISLYKLCGMSSKDNLRFAITEGIIVGASGAVTGSVIGIVVNRLLPVLGSLISHNVEYGVIPYTVIITSLVCGVIFALIWLLIASLSKNAKPIAINESFRQ